MGSASSESVPFLDLSKEPKALEQGTEEWKLMSQSVCEALERHGCLLVHYDKVSEELREEMFAAMRSLFDLPVETKRRNANSGTVKVFKYLAPNEVLPLYETLGVMNAVLPEKAQAFTDLMWPEGNDQFCKTINSMSNKMLGLGQILVKMILDSYEVGRYYDSHIASGDVHLQMLRYAAPSTEVPAVGVPQHTDANFLTILCQNEVGGLLIRTKEGEWLPVIPGKGSFIIFVGQSLRAWTNGRLYPPLHKVIMNGEKDRLSCGVFLMPKQDQIVEAPRELVDEEHPPLFKPYPYGEFLAYSNANGARENSVVEFAGI